MTLLDWIIIAVITLVSRSITNNDIQELEMRIESLKDKLIY